jgi:hypothetical protein
LRRVPTDLGIPDVPRAPLSYLLDIIYNRDLWMHRIDLTRATGQPFVVGAHDSHILAQAIRDLARQWTGPPVALELTGPAGGLWTIGAGRPVLTTAGLASHAASRARSGARTSADPCVDQVALSVKVDTEGSRLVSTVGPG